MESNDLRSRGNYLRLTMSRLAVLPDERRPRFQLIPFERINLSTAPNYLVKGLVPRVGLTVIWGPPKSGKSFFTLDLLAHVAAGWHFRKLRVQQGPIVYFVLEGDEGFKARIEAFRKQHLTVDHERIPLYYVAARLDLVKDVAALIAAIGAQMRPEEVPAAVAIDTLNRSLGGSESSDQDMSAYVRAADSIRDAFRCAVVVVHHCGIDASRPRGHSSLTGAVDSQIAIKRDGANNIVAELEWMKDGPQGEVIVSRLEPIQVGIDDDGDPITSCVLTPIEGGSAPKASSRPLAPRTRRALEALTESLLDHGRIPPSFLGLPGSISSAVEAERWREELFRRGVLDDQAKNPRKPFFDIKDQLADRRLIAERDGWVWLVPP